MQATRALSLGMMLTATMLAGCLAQTAEPLDPPAGDAARRVVGSFTELLCDPACNILMTHDAGPGNEVALAMDPNNPLRLLAGAKDYNNRFTDCVTISWFFSEDGGKSWREGYFKPARDLPLPHPTTLPVDLPGDAGKSCESDPVPVFDGQGNALMSTLSYGGTDPPAGLPTYRLAPGATEWEAVAHAYEGTSDKQWADVDPETGVVYIITRDLKQGAQHSEQLVKSADGGVTWEHVAYFDGIDFAQIAVRPGGHIVLAGLDTAADGVRVITLHSGDGGATWDPAVTIADLSLEFSASFLGGTKLYRTPPLPAVAAADGVPRFAVAYFDAVSPTDWDVLVRVSEDNGMTWGDPVPVADDGRGAHQWTPAVALSPSGNVHVTFFDARNDPLLGDGRLVDLYYAHSADGKSFDPNLRITDESFIPYLSRHQDQPFFIGDYLGVQASDSHAVMIWPDTRFGRSDVFAAIVGGGTG